MAIKIVDELKVYFQTGKKPTQQQFYDWLESFVHKNDGIAIVNVAGLTAALLAKVDKTQFDAFEQGVLLAFDADAEIEINGGTLVEQVIPFYGSTGSMNISEVAMGNSDLVEGQEINAGWNQPIILNRMFENNGSLFIEGIPSGSKLVLLKRKIKMA